MINFDQVETRRTNLRLLKINCPICCNSLFQKVTYIGKNQIKFGPIVCVECKKFTKEPKIYTTEIPGWGYPLEQWGF